MQGERRDTLAPPSAGTMCADPPGTPQEARGLEAESVAAANAADGKQRAKELQLIKALPDAEVLPVLLGDARVVADLLVHPACLSALLDSEQAWPPPRVPPPDAPGGRAGRVLATRVRRRTPQAGGGRGSAPGPGCIQRVMGAWKVRALTECGVCSGRGARGPGRRGGRARRIARKGASNVLPRSDEPPISASTNSSKCGVHA